MGKWRSHRFIVLVIVCMAITSRDALCHFKETSTSKISCLPYEIMTDYRVFYTVGHLAQNAFIFSMGGMMANTEFDPLLQKHWPGREEDRLPNSELPHSKWNSLFDPFNTWGDITQYTYAIPAYLLLMWLPQEQISCWANHSLRSLLLGGPLQGGFSYLLGAGRPVSHSPQWHLMKYHRAVSGHAFYGALPLINVAMQTDQPFIKGIFYAASVLPGLARINNNSHYFSQVFLGWWLAFAATRTVWENDKVSKKSHTLSWQINPVNDGISLEVWKNF